MVSGSFVGIDNHTYWVYFDGVGVPNAKVTLSNVVISMDAGDRKFVGFKTTSCKVSIVTDTPLTWAYTESSTGISVSVVDATTAETIFAGYVVPFAFEQPVSGCADGVTIDCVDSLTANKEVPYASVGEHGTDVQAYRIVDEIVKYTSAKEVIYHDNFGDNSSEKTFDAKVAQAGFLQDGMTILEALTAMCMFFGYTCVLRGDKLYFYDEHAMLHSTDDLRRRCTIRTLSTATDVKQSGYLRRVEVGEVHNDISLTFERAYDGIQITASGSDTSVILPDVCGAENATKNTDGRGTAPVAIQTDILTKKEERTPIESKLMDLGYNDGGQFKEWDNPDVLISNSWRDGAMLLKTTDLEFQSQVIPGYTEPRYINWYERGEDSIILWLRARTDGAVMIGSQKKRYSHTGGLVQLALKFRELKDDTKNLTDESEQIPNYLGFINIKCGDYYFVGDYDDLGSPEWSISPQSRLLINKQTKKGELLPTIESIYQENASAFLIKSPSSEPIGIELRWADAGAAGYTECFAITKLELIGFGDELWEGHRDMRHEYVAEPREWLEVESSLTTRASNQGDNPDMITKAIGINARPGIVPGDTFPCGGYMGGDLTEMPACGVLMEQLKARYGAPHIRYTMTVDSEVLPCDIVVFGGKEYTVEGYERDLANNTTRIIIN